MILGDEIMDDLMQHHKNELTMRTLLWREISFRGHRPERSMRLP
jgi:hypothetical protein